MSGVYLDDGFKRERRVNVQMVLGILGIWLLLGLALAWAWYGFHEAIR